jgi:hypothetical protein
MDKESIYVSTSDEEDNNSTVSSDSSESEHPIRPSSAPYTFIPSSREKFTTRPDRPSSGERPSTSTNGYKREREYDYVPHSKYTRPYRPKPKTKPKTETKPKAKPSRIFQLVPGQCPEPEHYDDACATLFEKDWSTYTRSSKKGGGNKALKRKLLLLTHPDKAELQSSAMYPYRQCTAFKTHCFDKVQNK